MIWLLTLEQVLLLHKPIIEQSGGSTGIRNQGLLESALGFSLKLPG
jgi:prophage maintenance system killer protein